MEICEFVPEREELLAIAAPRGEEHEKPRPRSVERVGFRVEYLGEIGVIGNFKEVWRGYKSSSL